MGEFDAYTVEDLNEIVDPDRPHELTAQAEDWGRLASLLGEYATAMHTRLGQARSSWGGAAAEAFFGGLGRHAGHLSAAGETADGNAGAVAAMSSIAADAQSQVSRIHSQWRDHQATATSPADADARRRPFDLAAREVMERMAADADAQRAALR
ncbi:MAG TPA: hypothetical protein VE172_16440, partial [Stackebrandtia sp.]|nr:hypothetical protein [Stackebrandtia sp.]